MHGTARRIQFALSVLAIGFAIEGAAELYALLTPGAFTPGTGFLFAFPVVLALVGLGIVGVGRDEWSAIERARARTATSVFGASVGCGVGAAVLIALLAEQPSLGAPVWAAVLFGALATAVIFGTFVTYGYLVSGLASPVGKALVLGAVGWSVGVSVLVGVVLASNLGVVLGMIATRTVAVPGFVTTADGLVAYLCVAFFLLLAAAIDALVSVARGAAGTTARPGASATR
jgi:hypothetical protein